MKQIDKLKLDKILSQVRKPGRYCGGEFNMIKKDHNKVDVKICLIYPDVYDIGMSFYGYQLLYNLVNAKKSFVAERSYSPWFDMEELMRLENLPLFSLETLTPLSEFDLLGFTLQYEMTYTNILNILDLSKIPIFSKNRSEEDPIIIAGGSGAVNPEPIKDFIDIFVIGDGEEIIIKLMERIKKYKQQNYKRDDILKYLSSPKDGIYVPKYFQKNEYVIANKIKSLSKENYSIKPLVPIKEIVQDRLSLEVQRGCTAGCRFCQAGMIYRPIRERPYSELAKYTKDALKNTGYETISLLSLSTTDYTGLRPYFSLTKKYFNDNNISVSLPSLRLDSFNSKIVDDINNQKKSGITFAPEAGTQRLRDVINKNITEEDLFSSVKVALENNYKTLKFYFMIGLPTENDEDIAGIVDLIKRISEMSKSYGRIRINVSISTFIPKPLTPFQWEKQLLPEEADRIIHYLRNELKNTKVKLMTNDPYESLIESVVSRGDEKLNLVIYDVWENGGKFDAWSEKFDKDLWLNALKKYDIDPLKYTSKKNINDQLPWDFLDFGIKRDFLVEEREKAFKLESTIDCRDGCYFCGVCNKDLKMLQNNKNIYNDVEVDESKLKLEIEEENKLEDTEEWIVRMKFAKAGLIKYITHHDLFRIFQRSINILNLPIKYSQGFNRRPKISFGFPIPMSYAAFEEYVDMIFLKPISDIKSKFNEALPEGLKIISQAQIERKTPSIMIDTKEIIYKVKFYSDIDTDKIKNKYFDLRKNNNLKIKRKNKKKVKEINLREFIKDLEFGENYIIIKYKVVNSKTARVVELLKLLFGEDIPKFQGERLKVILKN
ncbi:MAG: TIGR03960 family B12-binding radical SAM protein [Candidatus Marinimicrobia bacterium]|nr:TIGR03960 family B12-binding radical SAM protein [Candidatus Neomarinimicrobiota bacterium]